MGSALGANRVDENIKNDEAPCYTFEESLKAVDRNEAIDTCSAQWLLIWAYAAYLDERPTESQRKSIEVFYRTMPDLCANGRRCFRRFTDAFPIRLDSRRSLMGWVQMAENACRIENGLTTVPFNYGQLMRRWRYPDGYI